MAQLWVQQGSAYAYMTGLSVVGGRLMVGLSDGRTIDAGPVVSGGANLMVLDSAEPVPGGTPAGTVIVRTP